ncbi:MAG: hypothetical protein KTR26_18375 [Flammeovirgaceae bacterium]|nr:hypothetical protein [Flammeovirgaceae bacterium]
MGSKALELFSLQVKQYQDDLMSEGNRVLLRKNDVELINRAKDLLIRDIKNRQIQKSTSTLIHRYFKNGNPSNCILVLLETANQQEKIPFGSIFILFKSKNPL